MTTYYDTFSGLIPAKEVTRYTNLPSRMQMVICEVTKTLRAYKQGERLEIPAHSLVNLAPQRGAFIRVNTASPRKY
jgi:hypothetical protein